MEMEMEMAMEMRWGWIDDDEEEEEQRWRRDGTLCVASPAFLPFRSSSSTSKQQLLQLPSPPHRLQPGRVSPMIPSGFDRRG